MLHQSAPVNPLTTAEYPLPAQRPSDSLLDCSSSRRALQLAPTPWRQALRHLLQASRENSTYTNFVISQELVRAKSTKEIL
jgi:hypothetical protein